MNHSENQIAEQIAELDPEIELILVESPARESLRRSGRQEMTRTVPMR